MKEEEKQTKTTKLKELLIKRNKLTQSPQAQVSFLGLDPVDISYRGTPGKLVNTSTSFALYPKYAKLSISYLFFTTLYLRFPKNNVYSCRCMSTRVHARAHTHAHLTRKAPVLSNQLYL